MPLITRTSFSLGDVLTTSEWNTQFDDVYNQVNNWVNGTDVLSATQVNADNLRMDGNTLSSTNTDGNVIINPNGTGDTVIDSSDINESSDTDITADTNQDQSNATLLTATVNNVTVVGTSGDAVKLETMSIGDYQIARNSDSAQNLSVFPNTGQDLGEGSNTNILLKPGVIEVFRCIATNTIQRSLNNGIGDFIQASTGVGHGSSNTRIVRIETTVASFGTSITQTNSTTLGTIWTINIPGVYTMHYMDRSSSATNLFGITLNSSQLSTNIGSVTSADIIGLGQQAVVNENFQVSGTRYLEVGDIIRAHDENTSTGNSDTSTRFSIIKIA